MVHYSPQHTQRGAVIHRLCSHLASNYILPVVLPPLHGAEVSHLLRKVVETCHRVGLLWSLRGAVDASGGVGAGECAVL